MSRYLDAKTAKRLRHDFERRGLAIVARCEDETRRRVLAGESIDSAFAVARREALLALAEAQSEFEAGLAIAAAQTESRYLPGPLDP